jgi:hypothetical protein
MMLTALNIIVVNDILKGQGDGVSKQLAKEAAARQAYYAMGWAPSKPIFRAYLFVRVLMMNVPDAS